MAIDEDRLDGLPEALRPVVARWYERLEETHASINLAADVENQLLRVVAVSDFAGSTLLRDWEYWQSRLEQLESPPDPEVLNRFADELAASEAGIDEVKSRLRRFRHRYMLHVLWREVAGTAEVAETLGALSALADRLVAAAGAYAERQLENRCGRFRDREGTIVPLVVLAMGKLGGGELNFSSDIDIVFLYPADGESDGPRTLSGQQYFTRLSQSIVSLLDEHTADGFVFRVDTRLRPFGDSGPPVTSFAALESYLLQHGRDWERYAYIKARIVGQAPPPAVADDLFGNLVVPFVYRRYLDYGVFESLREMYALIAAEVQRRDLADNVKLGPGGIREIEFIVQSMQLVRGGNREELQQPSLLRVLPALEGSRGLERAAVMRLREAYAFLRRLENFIQAMRDQQVHDLPTDDVDRDRLCVAMGYADWESLARDLDRHRRNVTREFEAIAFRDGDADAESELERRFAALWTSDASQQDWEAALSGQHDAGALAELLAAFQHAPSTLKIDAISLERLRRFMPRLLARVVQCDDPPLALERTLTVVNRILRRSAYVSLLNENRLATRRLVQLCESSSYVAAQIARYPVLLDELLEPGIETERIEKAEFETELESRLAHLPESDTEARMETLAQFQRASLFRVAVADFSGALPIMKVSDSLTFLAEAVLDFALESAWLDLTRKHGAPHYEIDGERHAAGFGIIGYGKLGGLELSYGSDLDLVFLHDSRGGRQMTDGDKPLDNAMFFGRLVRRLVHFLTTQTSSGVMYEIDTRLRPEGRKGVLVTSTDAFGRYQEENAWTWEHQALLRARPVAGSAAVAKDFERIRARTLMSRIRLAALQEDVVSMRARMRKELDRSEAGRFDLKHGRGGVGDIEFIVQYLVLRNARNFPAVIRFSDNIRQIAALAAVGRLDVQTAARLQDAYREFRRRLHHLSLNDRPPFVGDDELLAERDLVVAVWERHLGGRGS
jgi:[glutamine synthetase] adenylyltransferase / [glutamine synthetase]-adenylyl-L-tyrosine phosphorylase